MNEMRAALILQRLEKKKALKADRSHCDLSARAAQVCVGENAARQSKQVVPRLKMKNDNPHESQKEKFILEENCGVTTLSLTLSQWDCQYKVVWRFLCM